jgi:O-antigen/teichoic acid export membrane protein
MLKSLLKDTFIYGLTDFVFKFINFAIFPFYAYLLTVPEFGIFALVTTLTQLLWTFMNCGQTSALQRFYIDKQKEEVEKSRVAKTGFVCLLIFGSGVTLLSLTISYYFRAFFLDIFKLEWQFISLGILSALPYLIFYYCVTFLRINFLAWNFAFITISQNLLIICLSLLFAFYFQWGLLGCLLAITIGNCFSGLVGFFNIRKNIYAPFDRVLAKKMLIFGFPFIFTDMSNWICASLDRWMLGELASMTEVGYYSIAFKMGTVMIFIINAFGLAWTPYSMKLYDSEPNYRFIFSKSLTCWFFFLICIGTGLSLFAQEMLVLTTPPAYWPAAQLIPFISMGLAFHGTVLLSLSGLLIEHKTQRLILGTWLCALLNFSLNLFLIPRFGAKGAAFTCFLTYICQSFYFIYCSHKFHPIPLEYKKIGFCIVTIFFVLGISALLVSYSYSPLLIVVKLALFFVVILLGFMTKILSISGFIPFFRSFSVNKTMNLKN